MILERWGKNQDCVFNTSLLNFSASQGNARIGLGDGPKGGLRGLVELEEVKMNKCKSCGKEISTLNEECYKCYFGKKLPK